MKSKNEQLALEIKRRTMIDNLMTCLWLIFIVTTLGFGIISLFPSITAFIEWIVQIFMGLIVIAVFVAIPAYANWNEHRLEELEKRVESGGKSDE